MVKASKLMTAIALAATGTTLCSTALAAMAVDANIELDNTYRDGSYVAKDDRGLTQAGRVEANFSGKAGDNYVVSARASLLTKKDGTAATDDMWISLGTADTSVKLGRFEAADLFPLGRDTLVNHAGNVYIGNTLRGRKAGDVFHAALNSNLGGGFGVEIGLISTNNTTLVQSGSRGVRPLVSYANGPVSAALGFELGEYNSSNKIQGAALTGTYNFGSFSLSANIAQGKQDAAANEGQNAMGLILQTGGLVVGVISAKTDQAGGDEKVTTGYVNYSMPLFGIKGATVTPALSASKGQNNVTNTTKEETSFRVRLNYAF